MSFLLPGFLAAGLLIGLPIFLHLLRKKPRQQMRFPSLRFLGAHALRETRRQRIMRWLVLAMRCALIALIAAAFARPFFHQHRTGDGRGVIVAVDNSFSMQTAGRWEQLKTWALSQIGELADGDQVGILLMHPSPRWLVPMSEDLGTARAALTNLSPGWESTHYQEALLLASETLRNLPFQRRQIVWMADDQSLGWRNVRLAGGIPEAVEIEFAPAQETPKRQAAITAFAVRAINDRIVASVTVESFSPSTDTREITIFADGKPVATQTIEIEAGNPFKVQIPLENPDGAVVFRAQMTTDEVPPDDVAFASLMHRAGVPAYLSSMSGENDVDFVAYAIRATQLQKLDAVRVEILPDSLKWPRDGVVVIRSGGALAGDGAARFSDYLRNGGSAWMLVDGSAEQTKWLAENGITLTQRPSRADSQLRNLDVEHPILSPFVDGQLGALLALPFRKAWSLEGSSLFPIADWNDGTTAMAETSIGGGQLLLSGFDIRPQSTALPRSAVFVPLVHRAISWLAQKQPNKEVYLVGDVIPAGNQIGTWIAKDSPEVRKPTEVSGAFQASEPGVFALQSGDQEKIIVVNLDPAESNPAVDLQAREQLTAPPGESSQDTKVAGFTVPLSEENSEQSTALWWWVLAFAGLLLIGELVLSNRTAL